MDKAERDRLLIEAMDNYGDYLLRVVRAIVKDRTKAEDLVQESFIQYYQHADDFEYRASVKTYLYRIAVNRCRNLFKSWHYRKLELTRQAGVWLASSETPDDQVSLREEREYMKHLLDRLPLKYKEVIWLHYYADLSVSEMSDVLSCPVNTVKTRLVRGRRLMKGYLKEEMPDD